MFNWQKATLEKRWHSRNVASRVVAQPESRLSVVGHEDIAVSPDRLGFRPQCGVMALGQGSNADLSGRLSTSILLL